MSTPAVENFGSPTVVRGRDGHWYAFGPGNPLNPGEDRPMFPILRSADLTSWSHVGDVFTPETFPTWAKPDSNMWAPSIEFHHGRYHLYFTMRNIKGHEQTPNTAIGVATAPTPTGPWTDSGKPLVAPKLWDPPGEPTRYRTVIDADAMVTPDGARYLYYGGFGGGVHGIRLAEDGMSTVGEERKLTAVQTYEGPYVMRRGEWFYLFASSGHCCKGPASGYSVQVGRSRDPLGPFTDANGVPLASDSPGGTPVIAPNGNRFVATGHNAAVTDLAGQPWLTFNGIDRDKPYLNEPLRENRRPLLIDRLDWIDGWPVVRGGAGATDVPTEAPTAEGWLTDAFEGRDDLGNRWQRSPDWRIATEADGGHVVSSGGPGERILDSATATSGDTRVRGAVRLGAGSEGAAGFALTDHGDSDLTRVVIDREAGALRVDVRKDGRQAAQASAPLPDSYDHQNWHELAVEVRGHRLVAEVSEAGLYDPVATVEVRLPDGVAAGPLGLLARDTAASLDDVTATGLYRPHSERTPEPRPGALDPAASDEFSGQLDPAWNWVRDPAAAVADDALQFPVQRADLSGNSNSASLLTRPAPDGEWIAETRVRLPFGDAEPIAFPQAGLLAYAGDDHYLRLGARAHGDVPQAAYQQELPYAGAVVSNASNAGPIADVTWLRLSHRTDPANGEHELRAGTSVDGVTWTWSTVLTLPAHVDLRIALGAHGAGEVDDHTAHFDYFRLYWM
ncbi:MAG: family 43 glycosylhydrolase [Micromonosporaceae bacterium]